MGGKKENVEELEPMKDEALVEKVYDGVPIPEEMCVIWQDSKVLYPGMESVYRIKDKAIAKALKKVEMLDGFVLVSARKKKATDKKDAKVDELCEVCTLARVVDIISMDGEFYENLVTLSGLARMKMGEAVKEKGVYKAKAHLYPFQNIDDEQKVEFMAACDVLQDKTMHLLTLKHMPPNIIADVHDATRENMMAKVLEVEDCDQHVVQKLLEEDSPLNGVIMLAKEMDEHLKIVGMISNVQKKARAEMDGQHQQYVLRQQIKMLQNELDGGEPLSSRYKRKAMSKVWPREVQEKYDKELDRLDIVNSSMPEYSQILDYLDTMLSLPWANYSRGQASLAKVEKRLDADHYGLEKVKERIIEHIAVKKLRKDMKSPVLCLYGPPGVGKTSLGKSIAEASGLEYVRVALGGVHDESEIRGHRRTYIGAMVGRILKELKGKRTSNPVFVLDEIDKITKDAQGDPEAALLELLDPEQNASFHDNYLDIDYDMSKVTFIATANSINDISQPLRDRMEMIQVSGYLPEEKEEIAIRHLLPQVMADAGLDKTSIVLSRKVIRYIIDNYTRESGVRELKRVLASVCRKVAIKKVKKVEYDVKLTVDDVKAILGNETCMHDEWEDDMKPGVVTGLAWTQVGGEILYVESCKSQGKGRLSMTGSLGDVMKESATVALEYIRANADSLGLNGIDFDATNIHVHVPEGAVPKDGPSAGVTMVTSMVSTLTGRKVRKRLAMTGEISLRGIVLPVGGIKEKVLAAKRAGIREIIMSEKNRRDVEEINEKYIEGLEMHYVKTIDEVVNMALEK